MFVSHTYEDNPNT